MMIGKLKTTGLTLAATMTLGIVTVGGVQAAQIHVNAGGAVVISGVQTTQNQFTTDVGVAKCQVLFHGLSIPTAQDVEVTPQFTTCNLSGINAVVDMNGCKFTMTGTGQPALQFKLDITGCTSGKVITITTATCTVTVPEQSGLGFITFANNASDANATFNVSGITYQSHGTCPNTASDHTSQTSNGQYTGGATFQASFLAGFEKRTHNGHQFETPKSSVGASLQVT